MAKDELARYRAKRNFALTPRAALDTAQVIDAAKRAAEIRRAEALG